jgi:glucose/arabinose dehydrogenase
MGPPEGITLGQWADRSQDPVVGYTAHSAPMQLSFYSGQACPEEYRSGAFVAMRGSWNRRPPSGYELSRVDFQDGQPKRWDNFAQGFLIEDANGGYGFLGRLAGVTEAPDGSLLLADDFNGIVYRISYNGIEDVAGATAAATPPDVTAKPLPSDIALNRHRSRRDRSRHQSGHRR